jgi:hypothetical protein
VTRAGLAARLDELFDNDLVYHGFTCYMRDYELIVFQSADPRSGIAPRHLRFLFRICPEVSVRSVVRPEVWSRSMDDALLSQRHVTRQSEGYIWGVQCQELYPGATVMGDSERARSWAGQVGVEFHEVEISANAHQISLVFADLQVEEVAVGYTPFAVGKTGIPEAYAADSKIPLADDQP